MILRSLTFTALALFSALILNAEDAPKPSVEDYIKLALVTGKAIREVAPDEIYVGPTTSETPYPYHEACYKAGLLPFWDAVSIHPYRQRDPETSAPEFHKLRALISHF